MPKHFDILNLEALGKLNKQILRNSGVGRLTPAFTRTPPNIIGRVGVKPAIPSRSPGLPPVTRRPQRQADRYVQFVIETKKPIKTDGEILDPVRKAMNATQFGGNSVANNLKVKPLFPGSDPNDNITKLARYYLLTVPVSFNNTLLIAKKRLGVFWDIAYQILEAGKPNFVLVDPDLPAMFYMRPLQEKIPGCMVGSGDAPDSVDWARQLIRLDKIPSPVPTGQGIRIGHIDTGHTNHPELNLQHRYDLSADRDFISDDNDATDPMNPGDSHGTATASVIASHHGSTWTDAVGANRPGVNGVAPECTLIAARAIDSVIIIFNTDVAQAVWHCIQQRVHIINLSLGGYANPWLQSVLSHAVYRENIIVTAAAGNCYPYVVFPAAYPEVIACGGIGIHPKTKSPRIWAGSAKGRSVDISAPAENVYVANFDDMGHPVVVNSEGTSFAAPHVGGVAALWLQRHGRTNLLNRYAGTDANLCEVFRHIIQTTAQNGPGWDSTKNGAGIIDAAATLTAPLPAANLFNKSLMQWKHMSEEEIAYVIFDFNQKTMDMINEFIKNGSITLNSFMEEFGREFNQLVGRSEDAWEDFTNGLEALANGAANSVQETAEAVEDVVEDVADAVSDTLSTVAGWFGL